MMSKPQDSDNRNSTESQCRSADNVKIQALNLVNFRLRFADNVKIQVLNTGICMVRAVNFQYSVPESWDCLTESQPKVNAAVLTMSRFRALNTENLHGARSKFSIFRRAWILRLSDSRLGFYTRERQQIKISQNSGTPVPKCSENGLADCSQNLGWYV